MSSARFLREVTGRGRFNRYDNRFRCRRIALLGYVTNRHEHVCLGEVGRGAITRDVIRNHGKAPRDAFFAGKVTYKIYQLASLQTGGSHVVAVKQNYAPAVMNATITIVKAVDRRVELIMAANGRHEELARLQIVIRKRMNCELCLAVRCFEYSLTRRIWQMKPTGLSHPQVVI